MESLSVKPRLGSDIHYIVGVFCFQEQIPVPGALRGELQGCAHIQVPQAEASSAAAAGTSRPEKSWPELVPVAVQ